MAWHSCGRMRRLLAASVLGLLVLVPGVSALGAGEEPAGVFDVPLRSLAEEFPCSEESALGDLTADAVRAAAGADIAFVCGGDLKGDLVRGPVTRGDIERAVAADRMTAVAELTAAQLFEMLEHALSFETLDAENQRLIPEESAFDGFLQLSGLRLVWDGSAPVGERVYRLETDDGTALRREDRDTVFSVAAAEDVFAGGYGYPAVPCESVGLTLADCLERYISSGGAVSPPAGRIRVIGVAGNGLVDALMPRYVLLLVLAGLTAASIFFSRKASNARKERFEPEEMRIRYF